MAWKVSEKRMNTGSDMNLRGARCTLIGTAVRKAPGSTHPIQPRTYHSVSLARTGTLAGASMQSASVSKALRESRYR
jgi:hypothetical protein